MKSSLVGLLLLLSACLVSTPVLAAEFRVAVSENASDIIRVENGELAGIAAPIYQCVFGGTGFDFSFVQLPLVRSLFHLENGEIAVAMPLASSPDRDRYGVFPGNLIDIRYLLLSFRELPPMEEAGDLLYVLPRGHLGARFVESVRTRRIEVSSWQQVFTMLKLGRADFTIVPQVILPDILREVDEPLYTQPAGSVPSSLYVSRAFLDTGLEQRLAESIDTCRVRFEDEIRQKQRMSGYPEEALQSQDDPEG
ncbi:hypothetical protein ACJO2E_02280 [Marinobacter sp. M1N3S26]|uniref:hypothetical protein n=1 Tax=unclassified Marinobacter TaxID=83889 RepID=UPI00387B67B1